jgi:hypothetical protein|tara:strand:+ start:117 stop:542 length:426 start_codon:yes stop_codon:yes gene_type:complete
MKKIFYLFLAISILSCEADADGNTPLEYLGTYRGDVMVYINSNYHSTLFNHSITFVAIGNSNEVMIEGNLIMTNTCEFDTNGFNIPETKPATLNVFYVLEYGSGTLSGNNLQIELHQDQIDVNTNNILNTGYWTGNLTKVE